MTDDDIQSDGGATKEEIFGTGDAVERARTPPAQRLKRMYDIYVRTPLLVGWSDWRTRIGGLGILFYILMGTVGVLIVPSPQINEGPNFLGPFEDFSIITGTDYIGRSVGKQVVHSTPAMLQMALAGIVFAIGLGVLIGLVAGYKGGTIDRALMTVTDVFIVLPGLPLIIVIASIYPPRDPFLVGSILAINAWAGLARQLRSQVLTLREEDYVEAARAMGLGTPTIIMQEIMPKLAPFILISAAGAATAVIVASVALYFLGILPFTSDNWGVMMNFARLRGNAIANPGHAGHWLFLPLLALSGLTFALTLFSQGLDRVFNPQLRARHSKTVTDDEGGEP
ncbi:ABC transporter permease [Halobacteria archaeon AArc-m2/3/4]|uniref:ABC transporter permease n=1 Tax=Natronoglomus mannanivorans TaxID=2979990 RepID=A0AAP2YY93_9EURY|nr:ABC transporter permease [Halobacteria archaeon AArc-xg1-1]MCU4972313.1 ABC transporter permease [Halobacteria archaeon AArc-m2/3/4]